MADERIHRVVSTDGTEIAGRVYGDGPPLVLVHGSIADGLSEWTPMLPILNGHFTCYLPDMRNRGLSDASEDHSREARVQDVVAFVESIGEPVLLAGSSAGGMLVLGAASRTAAVSAVVAREPLVLEALIDDKRARFADAIEQVSARLERGETGDAAMPFLQFISNDDEFAAITGDRDALDELATFLPIDLAEFREFLAFEGPSPTAREQLERITVPTHLLLGTKTGNPLFRESVRYATQHIPNATVHELPGAGHLGLLLNPEQEAQELRKLLSTPAS